MHFSLAMSKNAAIFQTRIQPTEAQTQDSMIRCEHLSFAYGTNAQALRDINLALGEGSFTFLSGKSGAGKSSLLSLFSLMKRPTSGTLTLFGRNPEMLSRDARAAMRRKIGCVYQYHSLLPHLTIAENVALPLKVAGESAKLMHKKTDELLHWSGLEAYKNERPEHLSGGEKQRAAIARAIITNPKLILADEPTGNLDKELSMRFMQLFRQLHKGGTTVLFATHDETLLTSFDYPRIRLEGGKLKR